MNYKDYFKNKKITMLGLGVLGRGVNVAKFLAECGAQLTITDLKGEEELASSLAELKKYKNITYILGRHRLGDFRKADMVIKAAGVPLDSSYIAEAKDHGVPVKMDASLFAELAPEDVVTVGITGTRGKSTVTHLVHDILKKAGRRVHLGGNVRGLATLPLLSKVKSGDIVIMELDSWQLQGFGNEKLSPHVAVFTTLMSDHLNYYGGSMKKYAMDKTHIFRYQTVENVFILGKQARRELKKLFPKLTLGNGEVGKVDETFLPQSWKLRMPGVHNRYNAALALMVADTFGVSRKLSKKVCTEFKGVPGRLEYVGTKKGIMFYNDTTATTPDGGLAALHALGNTKKKHIILLAGGTDKGLSYNGFARAISKYTKCTILFEGTGTDKLIESMSQKQQKNARVVSSMEDAFVHVKEVAQKGDIVLLSPAAASFGVFKNEFDRGEQFMRSVKEY